MGDTLSVQLDSSQTTVQPSLEEEAAKYDTPAPEAERPEWLPEKFKSPEDLAKAYKELQARFSSGNRTLPDEDTAEPAPSNVEEEAAPTDQEVEDQARDAVESAGLNFDDLSRKYWENGALDEADFDTLEKSGIPRHLVEGYIRGQEAILESTRRSVVETVGGEEAYDSMTEWAKEALSEAEIDAYNRAVNSGDLQMTMMAVKGLNARYRAENGAEPVRQVNGAAAKAGAETYRSLAELQKDMSDPRYAKDPAFRRDVENKLARSDIM